MRSNLGCREALSAFDFPSAKWRGQILAIVGLLVMAGFASAQVPPSMAGLPALTESPAQRDARMGWWRDAKFGLFIHWGPVSIKGVEIGWGRKAPRIYDINGHTERGRDSEYDNLYKSFDPEKFNAAEWVKIAQEAGMKYIVLVCKHHDGFSMFHTKVSDYSIANTPFKRDIVKELADACHAAGMKFGVYYSQRDWYHPDYLLGDNKKYNAFYQEQVRELLTNYGNVDIMWFDHVAGFWSDYTYDELYPMIFKLHPQILVNDRGAKFCGKGRNKAESTLSKLPETPEARKVVNGDFYTPEQRTGGMDLARDWESCITICKQWSWKPGDEMKTLSECVRTLVTCVSGGGNLLFNVGPMPTGEIEPRQIDRLKEIGAWLKKYGESIYGTRGGPFNNGLWGGSTHRDKTLWLHVFSWRGDQLKLPPLPVKVVAIESLSGGKPSFIQSDKGLDITLAKADQDPIDTVLELTLDQPLPPKLALGSARSIFDDPAFGSVLISKSNVKTDAANLVYLIDLGAMKDVCGISLQTPKGKPGPKELKASVSPDGQSWAPAWILDRWEQPMEIALMQTVAGAEVPGRPARWIKLESPLPLEFQQVKVYGKAP